MANEEEPSKPIETLEDAIARIGELESALDESITLLIKRDDQIVAYERQIMQLEQKLDAATAENDD